jgi:hypothetical protein
MEDQMEDAQKVPQRTSAGHNENSSRERDEWHYQVEGRKFGPVSLQAMKNLLHLGVILRDSLVWKPDFGDQWRPVRETEIVPDPALPPRPADTSPQSSPNLEWYYEHKGKRVGPVTTNALRAMVQSGDVSFDTMVWNAGLGQQWKSVRETEIGKSNLPPPLPASQINNNFALVIALVPVIGIAIEVAVNAATGWSAPAGILWLVYTPVQFVLVMLDMDQIEKSGRRTSHGWLIWFLIMPVYLYKRAKAVGQPLTYLWLWLLSCVAAAAILAMSTP